MTSVSVSLVLALSLPRRAVAEWPPCGRAIATAPDAQDHSAATTDGAGGAIITWHDERFPNVNVFAQHVLASGELDAAWPVDGQALLTDPVAIQGADGGQVSPVIVSDGEGGAIVAWEDNRSPVTETDVFAQHILSNGVVDPAWPADGAPLSVIAGLQNTLAIAPPWPSETASGRDSVTPAAEMPRPFTGQSGSTTPVASTCSAKMWKVLATRPSVHATIAPWAPSAAIVGRP